MAEKRLNSRIIHKHDIETDWLKSSFVPLQGEAVIFDVDDNYDYERIKIGDGIHNVNDLPFVNDHITFAEIDEICGQVYQDTTSGEVTF